MFLVGLVLLFLGIQLKVVKTYELKPSVTQFIETQIAKRLSNASITSMTSSYNDELWSNFPPASAPFPSTRSFSPPSWLAFTFISVGAVLILICPCYR